MALDRSLQGMLAKVERVVAGRDIAGTVEQVRAIIGPEQIPDSERLAQIALEKMRRGEVPTPEEMAALAIVIRTLRPVLLVRNGALPELPRDPAHDLHSPEDRARWEAFRQIAGPIVASVGRIERENGDHVGTGFLVRPGVLATNRHVLSQLTYGSETLLPSRPARISFGREEGVPGNLQDVVTISGVVAVHPELDVALLSVPVQQRSLPAMSREPLKEGTPVAVIGYPAQDNQNPSFLKPVFNGIYGVKRVAIGELLDGGSGESAHHDCSTTQGNSGSPLLSLETGQVVAIHRSGRFMYRNDAVPFAAWEAFLQGASG